MSRTAEKESQPNEELNQWTNQSTEKFQRDSDKKIETVFITRG